MESLNKVDKINEIMGKNLYNSFLEVCSLLREKRDFQQTSKMCQEVLNTPNINYNTNEKALIKFVDFKANIELKNFNYSENLDGQIIEMLSVENFEKKYSFL